MKNDDIIISLLSELSLNNQPQLESIQTYF